MERSVSNPTPTDSKDPSGRMQPASKAKSVENEDSTTKQPVTNVNSKNSSSPRHTSAACKSRRQKNSDDVQDLPVGELNVTANNELCVPLGQFIQKIILLD